MSINLGLPASYRSYFYAVVTSIGIALSLSATTEAKIPSNAELFEIVQALQARVAVLEKQNEALLRRSTKPGEQQQRARLHLANISHGPEPKELTTQSPMLLGRPEESGEPPREPVDSWTGWYWGASFGAGITTTDAFERTASLSTSTTSAPVSGLQLTTADRETSHAATVDLYLGLNGRIASRWIGGVQVEGSISDNQFRTKNLSVNRTSNGSSNTFQSIFDAEAEWMVSALGRAGWLATPSTLLYGLTGWSYTRLDVDSVGNTANESIDAHALVVGSGIERQVSPNWTVRAEYRYAHFFDPSLDQTTVLTFSSPTSSGAFTTTTNADYELDMHTARIGITRYLNGGN